LLQPLLHLGFALTGVGAVLLGCILPRLSAEWHLRDKDAGLLLLVQFATAALGALLVRRNLWQALACGYALFSAGSISIFLLQSRALPAFAAYRKGAALAILNFSWSAGAVACPLLAAQFLRHARGSTAFGMLGLCVLPFALLPFFADQRVLDAPAGLEPSLGALREIRAISYFALLAFLYVGMESAVGNWMSTFAIRAASWSFSGSSLAVSVFWAALLLGRLLTPAMLAILPERRLYRASVVATIAGISLLLAAHGPRTVLAGSVLTGLALAPMFPLIISLLMAEMGESRNAGWVFATAGLGGAVLSWLTGTVSTDTGSLRIGLLVPAGAALLMLVLIIWRRSNPATGRTQEPILQPTLTEKV
jgi:fucose permease